MDDRVPDDVAEDLAILRQRALDDAVPLLERLQAAVTRMERISDLLCYEVEQKGRHGG